MISKLSKIFPLIFILVLLTHSAVRAEVIEPIKLLEDKDYSVNTDEFVFPLTMTDLGFEEPIRLQGPYQEVTAIFALPADWVASSPVNFEFKLSSDFQSIMQAFISDEQNENLSSVKGILNFYLNGESIGETIIGESGVFSSSFEVEPDALMVDLGENELTITWDAEAACQYGTTTAITIDPTSSINISYNLQDINLRLNDFPKPFYREYDLKPYPVALILPENPDENDLSALLAVSAGLGKQSDGRLSYDVFRANEIPQTSLDQSQLVLIGKFENLQPFFEKAGKTIDLASLSDQTDPESGIIELMNSPWNAGRALLLVSGESPAALQKASASIAADDFLPFADGNLAVISQIPEASSSQLEIDLELRNLEHHNEMLVEDIGDTTLVFPFNIPGDIQISSEAYFEIYYRHSQLIDYLQSSLTITINGTKIGSVRFSDQSAENGLARIILPPDVIKPLNNVLEITATIVPQDLCADERSGNFWISVFEESYLHLPPTLEEGVAQSSNDGLDGLPESILTDNSLANLTFVADRDDWQSWQYASGLAYILGTFTDAEVLRPSAFFEDAAVKDHPELTFILLGKTTDLPFLMQINDDLPLAFNEDGSLDPASMSGIQFSMDASQPIGILQTVRLVDSGPLMFCVLGNSDAGLKSAYTAANSAIQEKIGTSANIEIIDGIGDAHFFLVEQTTPAVDSAQTSQSKWYERIFGLNTEKTNQYLLIGTTLVTVCFIIWTGVSNSKKRKNK
jgi:hypothetical protein